MRQYIESIFWGLNWQNRASVANGRAKAISIPHTYIASYTKKKTIRFETLSLSLMPFSNARKYQNQMPVMHKIFFSSSTLRFNLFPLYWGRLFYILFLNSCVVLGVLFICEKITGFLCESL